MANYDKEIYDLGQVLGYLGRTINFENEPQAPEVLNTGLSYYHEYFKLTKKLKQTPAFAQDSAVKSYLDFQRLVAPTQINDIIIFFRSLEEEPEEEKEKREPVKEDSTVPAELETLVYQYQQAKANELEEDPVHSVANDVKRALNVWNIRHKAELIRENRLALIKDDTERKKQAEIDKIEQDLFLVETINPKAESASVISQNIERVSRQTIMAEIAIIQKENSSFTITSAQINRAVEELKYNSFTGANITDYKNLSLNSRFALANQGVSVDPDINNIVEKAKELDQSLETNRFSDEPDKIEKEIISLDEKIQKKLVAHTDELTLVLNKINLDFDVNLEKAQKEQSAILDGLIKVIPHPRSPLPATAPTPLHQNIQGLEKALRQSDTSILINPEGLGARTIAILQTTNSENRNLSPEALRLYSLGLTPEKLNQALKDTNSPLSLFFKTDVGKTVYQQVHFQLGKIHHSKLGQEIRDGLKIPTGLSGRINDFYNRLPPAVQTATKLILNPRGTVYAWVNKQIGQRAGKLILKNFGGATAKKLGNFILNNGLKEGAKRFAEAAAKKLILAAAKQAGIQGAKMAGMVAAESAIASLAVALGVSTFGLSLIIGAILMVVTAVIDVTIGVVKKGLDKVWQELGWGEKFRTRDLLAPLLVIGGAAATAGAVAFGGFVFIVRTAQIAVVSAVGIVIGAVVTIGLYLGFAYLVAPMLSTLVQLDSVEKVNYNSMSTTSTTPIPGCPSSWPVKGSYRITQGPGGKYSHYSPAYSQSVDIATPVGTPIYSTTDGVVSFAGVSAPYLNTKIVVIDSKLPSGTTFQVVYAHLSFMKVGKGQSVKAGAIIGTTGTAGSGAHLHYEYKGIKYNQCPAGALQLAENCSASQIPGAGKKCVPDAPGNFLYTN